MKTRQILRRDIARFEHENEQMPCKKLQEKIEYYKITLFNLERYGRKK